MSDLGDRLRELPLPPMDEARVEAGKRAPALVRPSHAPRRRFAIRTRRVAAVALVFLGAVVAFAFTPPGRALSGELGELVGIGEPAEVGERATLPPSNAPPQFPLRVRPVVIASGRTPDGTPYEVVASRGIDRQPRRVLTCLTVDLPASPALETGEICLEPRHAQFRGRRKLEYITVADRAAQGREHQFAGSTTRYVLTALLSPKVERVDVMYRDARGNRQAAYSDVGQVDKRIARIIGTKPRLGYLVAFLPDDGLPSAQAARHSPSERRVAGVLGTVTLIAYDSSARPVARQGYGITIRRHYEVREGRRLKLEHFRERIEAAQRRDGLALNRANVELCGKAMLAGVRSKPCQELIHEAAVRELFGWTTRPN